MNETKKTAQHSKSNEVDARAPYERPLVTKKRSVARVTLFSGSAASGASGLTSA